jgi:hypothetical protein
MALFLTDSKKCPRESIRGSGSIRYAPGTAIAEIRTLCSFNYSFQQVRVIY